MCIVVKTRQDAIDKTRARGVISEFLILATGLQGSHASLKVLEFFFCLNLRPWKYLKTRQVLQSTWIWCCRYRTEKSWNLISLQNHTYDHCSKMWHWCWRSSRLDSVQHSVTRFTHLSCLLNNLMGLYYSFFIFKKKTIVSLFGRVSRLYCIL